ncbi:zinc ribbon domain-containing protein [bacterium]|nr:zinc ribbon domain-containing protein [bacterium]
MSLIQKRFVSFKNNLTKIKNKEPLGMLSLIVIIFLDIFVLSVLFTGLADHTKQLTSPSHYAPQTCHEVFIKQNWTPENKLDQLQELILSDYYDRRHSPTIDIKRMQPKCQEFYENVEKIKADPLLIKFFLQRRSLQEESNQLNRKAASRKPVTDNTLLTDISREEYLNKHPAISATTKAETDKLEILTSKIDKINYEIYNKQEVKNLFQVITSWDSKQRQEFIDDIEAFEQWYKYKELGWQMLFLIPLLLIFYLWNHRSLKKESGLQVLISTHLLVIIAIPIFIKIIELVLELIPKHFLKKLFQALTALHLVAIWHYILILLSVLVAIFLIYIIQKKLFNKKRLQQKRLSNSSCIECGKKLPDNVKFCPFCGKQQVETCSECKIETYICGDFCINCGDKRDNDAVEL